MRPRRARRIARLYGVAELCGFFTPVKFLIMKRIYLFFKMVGRHYGHGIGRPPRMGISTAWQIAGIYATDVF